MELPKGDQMLQAPRAHLPETQHERLEDGAQPLEACKGRHTYIARSCEKDTRPRQQLTLGNKLHDQQARLRAGDGAGLVRCSRLRVLLRMQARHEKSHVPDAIAVRGGDRAGHIQAQGAKECRI